MKNENVSIVTMYGITPCHAGSGSSLGVVDLPIQRERASNWPVIQASGVKGAFRANFDKYKNNIPEEKRETKNDFEKLTKTIFGCSKFFEEKDNPTDEEKKKDSGFAGSLSVSDAKILAYPMRSNVSPFVWITCPSVLKRLARDMDFAGEEIDFDESLYNVKETDSKCLKGDISGSVLLEDYQVEVEGTVEEKQFAPFLKDAERLLLVSDDVFNYGVSDCTQIMAQIKIDQETGTTADGSLRYQEELPSDTIMYSVISWGDSKNTMEEKLKAETIRNFIKDQVIQTHIQIAGDESCGRGIFKLSWN